ncbi:hypothetical protein JR316_0003983 [Psilocybe cubensis]|uniref:Uncharacterized protein n=2 Tax=Psilocybe cubensis TaxID=181762 RepID=A0ACB8H9F8_PSICU|nr:hypothetical protein JR316_0003983 [Psilocybe cubensis]KAH9484501.1 hypothetical protein JR316_0003983 [Psilocybe cubensis]
MLAHCRDTRPAAVSAAAADISRILDPSYLPSSSTRPSPTFTRAYVDKNGDLHDPDYRHFPSPAHKLPQRQKQHSLSSSYSHSSASSASRVSPSTTSSNTRRPQFDWEIDLDESALDDESEEWQNHHQRNRYSAPPTRSWSTSSHTTNNNAYTTRPRESSFSTMSMYTPTSTYYSPTGTSSTLPTSYEDDTDAVLSESPFEEKVHALQREREREKKHRRRLSKGDREKERMRLREEKERAQRQEDEEREVREMREKMECQEEETTRQRRMSVERPLSAGAGRRASRQVYDLDEDDDAFVTAREESTILDDADDDSAHLRAPTLVSRVRSRSRSRSAAKNTATSTLAPTAQESEYVPSCTQSLKRQWQAFALGFRFGVFRAQRRVMRRVASLM